MQQPKRTAVTKRAIEAAKADIARAVARMATVPYEHALRLQRMTQRKEAALKILENGR